MKLASVIQFAALFSTAWSRPMNKMGHKMSSDVAILNYALTLESLEAAFWTQGTKNYTQQDFEKAGVRDPKFHTRLVKIRDEERTHEHFITSAITALGAKAAQPCIYTFPATDAASFLALANVIEGVGVSAYIGAANNITNGTHVKEAASILSVEARHTAYLNSQSGLSPFPSPFDIPLRIDEVFSLASNFIVKCPSTNPPLPVKTFPPLTVMVSGPKITPGSMITLETKPKAINATKNIQAAFVSPTGPKWVSLDKTGPGKFQVTIPMSLAGQNYLVLTQGRKVTDESIVAGPAVIEVVPKNQTVNPVLVSVKKLMEMV